MDMACTMYQQQRMPGDDQHIIECARHASQLYLVYGAPDQAANVLERAAKTLESMQVQDALTLYQEACDLYVSEGRGSFGLETFQRTANAYLRHQQYQQAANTLQLLIDQSQNLRNKSTQYKACISIIIIHLSLGDLVEAGKRLQSFAETVQGFIESDEYQCSHQLVECFEQFDSTTLETLLHGPLIRFLDSEFIRLARTLRIPGGSKPLDSSNIIDEDEDEGLC
jgi:tetratricopeptide (TPR) repeat protein